MARAKQPARISTNAFHPEDVIGEILERDPRVEAVLARFGLPCSRCVVKDVETLAEGCAPLGLKTEEVLAELNALGPRAG